MTYYYKSPEGRATGGAGISASISWETEAGTFLSNSSTDETNSGGSVVGETLQVSVMTLASGSEIPSYNCTSMFHFTDKTTTVYTYALNSVAWTCVSPTVLTWCTRFKLPFQQLLGVAVLIFNNLPQTISDIQ